MQRWNSSWVRRIACNVSLAVVKRFYLDCVSHLYLWFFRFYLKEFRGSRRWLLFLEGEYLKSQLVNSVPTGQLVLAWRPRWNFDGHVIFWVSPFLAACTCLNTAWILGEQRRWTLCVPNVLHGCKDRIMDGCRVYSPEQRHPINWFC